MTPQAFREQSLLKIFISYFRPHRGLFLLDMACALGICLIDLAFPAVSRWCMNALLPARDYSAFFTVMLAMAAAFALRAGLHYVISYYGHTFGILVEADIRRDLFHHMQDLSFGYYDKNRTGQLMSRLTADLFDITELAHHGPEDVFISGVTILGALGVMAVIQWRLALVIAVLLPVFFLVVTRCRQSMNDASAVVKQKTAAINADIESGLSGIRTAKAFANEAAELKKFDSANESFKASKRSFHKAMGRFNASMEFCLCALQVVVIAAGGWLIMQGQMDVVDLIAFSLYIAAFVTPVRRLSSFMELFANGTAGLKRFVELMGIEPDLQDADDAEDLARVAGQVDLEGVCFAYRDGLSVLKDITLHIRAGETVAVVGPSGGGKSTLCQLIPRFYDATQGQVLLDGKDVRQVTQRSLRRNIGVVQQEVFLFAASVLENIRYGRPDATVEEVLQAAKEAEIYDDIRALPDGFDTYVGERGALLSGGQKQRISIARIFLKDPPVLILDEATSALDSVTEAKIQATFDRLSAGRTTFIIAHRLSTVRGADRILVVENGHIVEEGPHQALLERNGAYAALYRSQELRDDG